MKTEKTITEKEYHNAVLIVREYEMQKEKKNKYFNESQERFNMIDEMLDQLHEEFGFRDKTRKREVVTFRQYIHYWLINNTVYTLNKIGKLTGGKNHATVLYSLRMVRGQISLPELHRCPELNRASKIIETRMQHLARQ